MLREDILSPLAQGRFAVYAVRDVDDAGRP
jgi:hypothetical protein